MSTVTDVILTGNSDEHAAFESINEWLTLVHHRPLALAHRLWESISVVGKAMQAFVGFGAFNYLDVDALKSAIVRAKWHTPASVHLFIQLEHDESGFHEIPLEWPASPKC